MNSDSRDQIVRLDSVSDERFLVVTTVSSNGWERCKIITVSVDRESGKITILSKIPVL